MATTKAQFKLIANEEILQRSSQTVTVVGDRAYVFGGELKPREPRDANIHVVELNSSIASSVKTLSASSGPTPRVGTAGAVIGKNIYSFSGRGGTAMTPIEESGAVWCFSTSNETWSQLSPKDTQAPYPEARSYHCATSDGNSHIYFHAGCPTSGRLADLWSFDVNERVWKRHSSAPDPPRGGTSIAYHKGKVYRMGGFDGKNELGGAIDIYDIDSDSWSMFSFEADGVKGPGCRSVSALLALDIRGKSSLVTMFGESDPSALGHEGAGHMLSDSWVWDVETKEWSKVVSEGESPKARGWFDADVAKIGGKDVVVVQGGLGENNERLDDVWVLGF